MNIQLQRARRTWKTSLLLDEKFIVPEDEHNEDSSSDGSDELISDNLEEFSAEEKNMF